MLERQRKLSLVLSILQIAGVMPIFFPTLFPLGRVITLLIILGGAAALAQPIMFRFRRDMFSWIVSAAGLGIVIVWTARLLGKW